MSKKSTPSFIHELPLRVNPHEAKVLSKRFEAARHLYNACLRESLRRLDLMRESRLWQKAGNTKDKKERSALYRKARETFSFNEYAFHAFAVTTKNDCFIGDHLDTHVCQKIASRAFAPTMDHATGKKGRPRFKRKGWLGSVEGKSSATGIRWRDDRVLWSKLELRPLFDKKDKHGVEAHALSCRVKYVRLVRRTINAEDRWFAQLILEGVPLWKEKNAIGDGFCGLDIGPSTIAIVGDKKASLEAFVPEIETLGNKLRLAQRAMDRSRRATNPDNYNENGTIKKGIRLKWNRSRRYIQMQEQIAEIQRKLAAARKISHGNLCNRTIAMGKNINTEKLSYRAFQKMWGKTIGHRAPGMFVEMLRRKAENAGGGLNEFPIYHTKFSQLCHNCGSLHKKQLKDRWHECDCGIGRIQRDLYSAFLSQQLRGDSLDIRLAHKAWPSAKPLLDRAVSRLNKTAIGGARLSSFGLGWRQSGSHGKDKSLTSGEVFLCEATDVVRGNPESRGKMVGLLSEPPGFIHGEV